MFENETYEVWVQDRADRSLFINRPLNLKLPEAALNNRPTHVLKIVYDSDTHPVLPFGYSWNEQDEITIDPVRANVILMVFRLSTEGLSAERIAKRFENMPNLDSSIVWHSTIVREILKNERTYRSGLLSGDSSLRLPIILK